MKQFNNLVYYIVFLILVTLDGIDKRLSKKRKRKQEKKETEDFFKKDTETRKSLHKEAATFPANKNLFNINVDEDVVKLLKGDEKQVITEPTRINRATYLVKSDREYLVAANSFITGYLSSYLKARIHLPVVDKNPANYPCVVTFSFIKKAGTTNYELHGFATPLPVMINILGTFV